MCKQGIYSYNPQTRGYLYGGDRNVRRKTVFET